jgi:DNA-binding PadR family transcriptional regulator
MNDLLFLAMMLAGPKYGYQLKREAGWIMGQDPVHNNIVYPLLRRFLEQGWVSKKEVPGERGQTRQQYAITGEGRRHLFERLNEFSDEDAASEPAFGVRVGMFVALKSEVREMILAKRESYLRHRDQKLEAMTANLETGKFGGEVVKHMRKQIEIELEWVAHLRRLAKSAEYRRMQ